MRNSNTFPISSECGSCASWGLLLGAGLTVFTFLSVAFTAPPTGQCSSAAHKHGSWSQDADVELSDHRSFPFLLGLFSSFNKWLRGSRGSARDGPLDNNSC